MFKGWISSNIPAEGAGRRLAAGSLVNNFGNGAQLAAFPLFLVSVADFSAAQVGLALMIAGIVGIASSPAAGWLSDRMTPSRLLVLGGFAQGAVAILLFFVNTVLALCVLAGVARVLSQIVRVARLSIVAQVPDATRNVLRAQMNVYSNVGVAMGTAVSAAVIAVGSKDAYLAGFVLDSVTFVASALVQQGLPSQERSPRDKHAQPTASPWRTALKDRRYAAVTVLNGFLFFHQSVLFLGIPLWIASTNEIPKVLATVIFLMNMAITILLQVKFSEGMENLRTAAVAWRRSALAISLACVLVYVAARAHGDAVQILAVLSAALLFTFGELWHSSTEMEVSTRLVPEEQHGLYQGIFALGRDAAQTAGPFLAALFCVSLNPDGWLILTALYALFAVAAPYALNRMHEGPVANQPTAAESAL
ncbi:MFS transporter [Streptomyces sp. NPDC060235]|uniref:MFS transporter n=1 Tax=Streptomyces sp. NPDC060235 TaxID=3347080 RepID=UPI00365970CE